MPNPVFAEVVQFAEEPQVPLERARQMAIAACSCKQVAAALSPYLDIGFDMFLLMERSPLDHQTLRLFMQEAAPRLRTSANQGS